MSVSAGRSAGRNVAVCLAGGALTWLQQAEVEEEKEMAKSAHAMFAPRGGTAEGWAVAGCGRLGVMLKRGNWGAAGGVRYDLLDMG